MWNLHRNHCAVALLSGSIDLFGIIQKENALCFPGEKQGALRFCGLKSHD